MNDPDLARLGISGIDFTINMLLRAKEMVEDGNPSGAVFILEGVAKPFMSQAINAISVIRSDCEE